MRTKSMAFLRALTFVATLSIPAGLTACREPGPEPGAEPAPKEAPTDRIRLSPEAVETGQIDTSEVALRPLREILEANGRVRVNVDESARIGAPTEGRVVAVDATVGDRVRKGQVLVSIHSHELIRFRSERAKAIASLTQAEHAWRYSQAEKERADRLLAAKALSVREKLQTEADLVAAEAEVNRWRAELQRTEDFLRHLGAELEGGDELAIPATRSGVVLTRGVSVGAVVSPAEDLMTIADLTSVWVVAEVRERSAGLMRPGIPVDVRVAAFPDEVFQGQVAYIGEQLAASTRTLEVRCLVQNSAQQLRPEMYATVSFDLGESDPVLTVPDESLSILGGRTVVFVDEGAGRYRRRPVQVGRRQGGFSEILEGASIGEIVVSKGAFLIKSEFLRGQFEEEH